MLTSLTEFGNDGVVYRLRSGYENFEWGEILERKRTEVVIPKDMTNQQLKLTWECLLQVKETVTMIRFEADEDDEVCTLKYPFSTDPMHAPTVNYWSALPEGPGREAFMMLLSNEKLKIPTDMTSGLTMLQWACDQGDLALVTRLCEVRWARITC